jgi:hypothetical protein
MSRHEPLPGTSASKDAIKPAVHDSAVASFLPRELRKETTRRGMFIRQPFTGYVSMN